MKRKLLAATFAAMALAIPASSAVAFGGPNSAGNSGHFHPNSNPCQGTNDQPNCPGPH